MALQDRLEFGTQQVATTEGKGFCLGLTEPEGGDIRLGIVLEHSGESMTPDQVIGVSCDAARARDIAAALIELAEVVEQSNAK